MFVRAVLIGLSFAACTSPGPRAGEWAFSDAMVEENACNLDESDVVPLGLFNLRVDGDDRFTVGLQDGSEPIDCTLDGGDFDCAPAVTTLPLGATTVDLTVTLAGLFTSSTAADVSQSLVGDCQGNACGLAEALLGVTLPCTVRLSYSIDWISDDLGVLAE